jgi:hypothetical protein
MIDIIKNRTLDANFKKLKLITNEELKDYRVQLNGPSTYIPHVVNKNTGEPVSDTHVVLLDTVTNELRVFEWTSPPPVNPGVAPMYYGVAPILMDYSGRYVVPPVAMHPSYMPNGHNSPRYTQDVMPDDTYITMFQPHGPDTIEPMLSIEGQVLKDQTKLNTVTFKRVTLQNQMDGKGVTWRLLNNYLCIVQESSVWYHSNAGMAPLTIDQAIEIGLNPIIGLCDANGLHGLESKWIAHVPTYNPLIASENVVIPCDGSGANQYHYPQPAHAFQEVFPQHFPHPNQVVFGEGQPARPMPKGYRRGNY